MTAHCRHEGSIPHPRGLGVGSNEPEKLGGRMKKLSTTQRETLRLMVGGWHLGYDSHMERSRLQLGGCGYGGDSKRIPNSTRLVLLRAGMIAEEQEYKYPTQTYYITYAGRFA